MRTEYIRREVKPKTKEELIDGIETFWLSRSVKSTLGIFVIPKIIELQGAATGY